MSGPHGRKVTARQKTRAAERKAPREGQPQPEPAASLEDWTVCSASPLGDALAAQLRARAPGRRLRAWREEREAFHAEATARGELRIELPLVPPQGWREGQLRAALASANAAHPR